MKRLLLAVLLLPFLVSFSRAEAPTSIPFTPAPHGLLTVRATVAGHDGTFLFDSGGGLSSLTPEFALAVGCHPWGQVTGFRMTGQRIDMQRCDHVAFTLSGKALPPGTVGVFDIAKLLPEDVGHIDGTLSLDLFADQAFTLSYGGRFLRLLDQSSLAQQTQRLRAMPVHVVRDVEGLALTVNLPVSSPAGIVWFEMDSGNTSSLVLVNKPLATLFHLPGDEDKSPSVSLTLSDGTPFTGKVKTLDLILDGNLGASFLAAHDVTVDLRRKTAWVSAYVPQPADGTKP